MRFLLWPYKKYLLKKAGKQFMNNLQEESMDFFLTNVLRLMDLLFFFSKKFRKNIKDFNARYLFKSIDGRIDAAVIFKNSKMQVKRHAIDNTNVTVVFRDGKALKDFLFSDSPDIIGAILDGAVTHSGNLNYLAKFAFMATHLKLQFARDK